MFNCVKCGTRLEVVNCYRRGDYWYQYAKMRRNESSFISCPKCHAVGIGTGYDLVVNDDRQFKIIDLEIEKPLETGETVYTYHSFMKRDLCGRKIVVVEDRGSYVLCKLDSGDIRSFDRHVLRRHRNEDAPNAMIGVAKRKNK